MRILNIRIGLATNSSSTHSIIVLPKGVVAKGIPPYESQCFGWDPFQLVGKDKIDYLAQSLYRQLLEQVGQDIALTVVQDWCGVDLDLGGYVDHQSALTFPRNWDGRGIDKGFFDAFKAFLEREDIVIGGGNDNEYSTPPVMDSGGQRPDMLNGLPKEDYGSTYVARQDGDYWTIFHRGSGTKLRITFEGDDFESMPTRSSAPELVDIKITDYCPYECAFCYQGSTKEGQHASVDWLGSLAYKLGKAKVFEVALGGGEPTLHPHFVDILGRFRYYGIVPNFTTKNLGWLEDEEKREAIFDRAGAFAYSVENAKDVNRLAESLERLDVTYTHRFDPGYRKITVQHIVGVVEEYEFLKVLMACTKHRLPLTLLGYKDVGRGPEFGRKPEAKWLDILSDFCSTNWMCVGIDTALVDRYWDQLVEKGISKRLMTREEGQFSCYIDAVDKTMNTSSYNNKPGVSIPDIYSTDIIALYRDLPR